MSLFSRSRDIVVGGLLLGAALILAGCDGPEMPVPPPRESTNPAEDDFVWIIERVEHALKMFQPPSNLGLSVKQDLKYKVIPPSDTQPHYTALVTITTKSVYNHGKLLSTRERERAKKEAVDSEVKLDDPYDLPDDQVDDLGIDVPSVEPPSREVPTPVIPAPLTVEKREFLFEYVDNHWELKTEDLEKTEKMWFDYALQSGEFGPDHQP